MNNTATAIKPLTLDLPAIAPASAPAPSLTERIAAFFHARGVAAYLVGGSVRDALLGRQSADMDIAAQADVASIGQALADAIGGRYLRLHQDWQIARIILPPGSNPAHIDLTAIDGDIERDLRRRDFTINAMALPLQDATYADWDDCLIDPCGGLRDLHSGIVRMTTSAALREDPLRMLRGARLAAQLGFALDDDTAAAIRRDAARLTHAAPERARDEFMKILQAPNTRKALRLLDDLGLLCALMPELAESKGVAQPKEHYYDVFNHLIESVGWVDAMFGGDIHDDSRADIDDDNHDVLGISATDVLSQVPLIDGIREYFGGAVSDGYDRLTFLKLTALLHDVAKPATKTIEASGRIRFIGHHIEGERAARETLTRLRFANGGVEHVARMVRHHLRPTQMAQKGDLPTTRALYRYYRDAGDTAVDTLYLNIADYLAARGPELEQGDWASHCELIRRILEEGGRQKSPETLSRLVNGYDIMKEFSLAPGPAIGKLLAMAQEAQACGDVTTRSQALALVERSLERGGDGA